MKVRTSPRGIFSGFGWKCQGRESPSLWDGKGHLTWKNRESLDETAKRSQNLVPYQKRPFPTRMGGKGNRGGSWFPLRPPNGPEVLKVFGFPAWRMASIPGPHDPLMLGTLDPLIVDRGPLRASVFFQTKVRREGNSPGFLCQKKWVIITGS